MTEAETAARIEALEAAVTELRGQLTGAHPGRVGAMRDTRRCPACHNGSLLHVRNIKEVSEGGLIGIGLTHDDSVPSRTLVFGPLEVFACKACRLVEWYAKDFGGIVPDGVGVIAIEPEAGPKSGPFR